MSVEAGLLSGPCNRCVQSSEPGSAGLIRVLELTAPARESATTRGGLPLAALRWWQ